MTYIEQGKNFKVLPMELRPQNVGNQANIKETTPSAG